MGGSMSRSKGRRGQLAFRLLLQDRDWTVAELNAGTSVADFWANDPHGKTWSVEVKNVAVLNVARFRRQAIEQAGSLPWLLGCKIPGTSSWLVLRQGERPVVWHEKKEKNNEY